MNVFYIPSWYPSVSDPVAGVFFRDQALALARHFPGVHAGISTWGQNDERLLLWSAKPASSIKKIIRAGKIPAKQKTVADRVTEYFTPAFTWTWKTGKGNIRNIIKANYENLKTFTANSGKADIIHAHVAFPAGYIARKLSAATGIPYLITEHMSPFPLKYFRARGGALAKRILEPYRHAAVNIAVSRALKAKMQHYEIPEVRVVYNSVDENLFYLPGKNIPPAPFTFFTLGRMVPQKGIDILLRAIGMIPADKEVLFKIGGGGTQLRNFRRLATELQIMNRIQWLGTLNRKQVAAEMRNCHAFVLPSRHESMGIVFAEAIACGKPVIGTRCGGPEEIITGINGFLIPRENAGALARALLRLVKEYRRFNAENIREDFMLRFSSKSVTKQIMKIYGEISLS